MSFSSHQFLGTLAYTLGHFTAHEAAMVEEEFLQTEIGIIQTLVEEKGSCASAN